MARKDKTAYNAYMKEYMNRRYQRRREYALNLLGNKCYNCGSTEDLEIDHIQPELKSFSISKFWSIKEDLFLKELEKCQLLCKSCHINKTNNDRGCNTRDQHGTVVCYDRGKCRCPLCKKAKSAYLKERKNKDQ